MLHMLDVRKIVLMIINNSIINTISIIYIIIILFCSRKHPPIKPARMIAKRTEI